MSEIDQQIEIQLEELKIVVLNRVERVEAALITAFKDASGTWAAREYEAGGTSRNGAADKMDL